VKEKLLAAHRGSIKVVIMPKDNEKDLVEIPQEVLQNLKCPVDMLDECFR